MCCSTLQMETRQRSNACWAKERVMRMLRCVTPSAPVTSVTSSCLGQYLTLTLTITTKYQTPTITCNLDILYWSLWGCCFWTAVYLWWCYCWVSICGFSNLNHKKQGWEILRIGHNVSRCIYTAHFKHRDGSQCSPPSLCSATLCTALQVLVITKLQ